jgi:sugar phosphate isomerase/epimerase
MQNQITTIDFNCDWYLKDYNLTPRSTPGDMTREDIISFLGTLKVDAVELMHDYWKDLPAATVRGIAHDAGLSIHCYIFVLDLALPVAQRSQAMDQLKKILDRVSELGAPTGMIIPGLVKENHTLDEQRAWMIDGLRASADLARTHKLTLLAENIDLAAIRPLMGHAADCRTLCEAVDSPAFRLIYDCGATRIINEDPVDALRTMAPYIGHVHLKNNRRLHPSDEVERSLESDHGERFTGCNLDQGEVDLTAVINELSQLDYQGAIALEYQGQEDPRKALPHNVSILRHLISAHGESA